MPGLVGPGKSQSLNLLEHRPAGDDGSVGWQQRLVRIA